MPLRYLRGLGVAAPHPIRVGSSTSLSWSREELLFKKLKNAFNSDLHRLHSSFSAPPASIRSNPYPFRIHAVKPVQAAGSALPCQIAAKLFTCAHGRKKGNEKPRKCPVGSPTETA